MTVGEKIRKRRIELDMTQEELAEKLGYKSRSSINKIELSRDLPLDKVRQMANVLDLPISYLLGWDNYPKDYFIETPNFETHIELISMYDNLPVDKKKLVYDYIKFLTNSSEN